MKVIRAQVGEIRENTYICYNDDTKECIIVDPGDINGTIIDLIIKNNLIPKAILLTHGHYDHILGVKAIKEKYKTPVYAHKLEKELLNNPEYNFSNHAKCSLTVDADYYVCDDEVINLIDYDFKSIRTNGHTLGSTCFYIKTEDVLFTGDTLFYRSIGRTDLYTSEPDEIVNSIVNKLMILPDKTIVYPGHGPKSKIISEKNENLYLR